MKGIFVNQTVSVPYADAIVAGIKTIETRRKNMLSACVGDRVAVIKTVSGRSPRIIGYVDIVRSDRNGVFWMDAHRDQTIIPEGSRFDGGCKWCYFLENPERCDPYPIPENAVRHGRSWCEW